MSHGYDFLNLEEWTLVIHTFLVWLILFMKYIYLLEQNGLGIISLLFIRTFTTDLLFILHCCFVPEKCIWFCQHSCLPTDSEDSSYSLISDYTHIQRFKRSLTQWKWISFTGTWKNPHIYLLRLPSRFFLSLYFQKLRPENDKHPPFTINFNIPK